MDDDEGDDNRISGTGKGKGMITKGMTKKSQEMVKVNE